MSLGRFSPVSPTVGVAPQVLLRYSQISASPKACDPCKLTADESGSVTVSVQALTTNPDIGFLPTDNISDAYVQIVFAGDNDKHVIETDFDSQIRFPALELTVNIIYPLIAGANYTQPDFVAHATVGRGSAGNIPATRTIKIGTVGAGASSSVFPVPAYARAVTVARPDVGNGTIIEFYSGGGVNAANLLQSEVMSKVLLQGIGIPNGARYFRLTNQAGVGTSNLAAIFTLHL